MKQITVRYRIRPDGRVEERVEGVEGEACRSLTERIEAAIGPVERQVATSASFHSRENRLNLAQSQHQSGDHL